MSRTEGASSSHFLRASLTDTIKSKVNLLSSMFFQEGDKIVPLEICLLRKISDIDGVIRLLDFYEMPETFVLILERPPRSKDLFDFINDHGFLDESLSRDFLRQVVDTILGKKNILKLFLFVH